MSGEWASSLKLPGRPVLSSTSWTLTYNIGGMSDAILDGLVAYVASAKSIANAEGNYALSFYSSMIEVNLKQALSSMGELIDGAPSREEALLVRRGLIGAHPNVGNEWFPHRIPPGTYMYFKYVGADGEITLRRGFVAESASKYMRVITRRGYRNFRYKRVVSFSFTRDGSAYGGHDERVLTIKSKSSLLGGVRIEFSAAPKEFV